MKVSFKEIAVRATLNGPAEKADAREMVANAVYQDAMNFEQHKLAHRIAETDGEIELTDKEAEAIKAAVANHYRFFFQKPIFEALGETFE